MAIIQGPATINFNAGTIVYFEGDISVTQNRETWNPRGATTGALGERYKAEHYVISGKPMGCINIAGGSIKEWPFSISDIGKSIMGKALVISPLTGNKWSFTNAGLHKMPGLKLAPTATAFSDNIEFVALDTPTLGATTPDASFVSTTVISPVYKAAFGATPYDTMDAEDGFTVEPQMSVRPMYSANYGIKDFILESLGVLARWAPISHGAAVDMTEADMATLLSTMTPGTPVGTATDLVISGTGLALTLKNMGPGTGGYRFGVAQFRLGEVAFHNKVTTSAPGVFNSLWAAA